MIAPYMAVAFGGAAGAIIRYAIIILAQNRWSLDFPYATLIVNTSGSFLAGFFITVLVGRFNAGESVRLFFFTGFLGAFTTFSSFASESLFMYEKSQWFKLLTNILANNVGSLLAVLIGYFIARLIVPAYFS